MPPLDRNTYFRLNELRDKQNISKHGLITIAINLLYEGLEGNVPAATFEDWVRSIQERTGIKRKRLTPGS